MTKEQRDRLEDARNFLENSYGWSSYRDGVVRDKIAEIDRLLQSENAN